MTMTELPALELSFLSHQALELSLFFGKLLCPDPIEL